MKNEKKIISSAMMVAGVSFFIKILGLIKQTVIAMYCGATAETDVFFVASGILVSLCAAVFSAVSISLLALYVEKLNHHGREKANSLIDDALHVLIPFSLALAAMFFVFSDQIGRIMAPTFDESHLIMLSRYVKMMSAAFFLWGYYLIVNVTLEAENVFLPGRMQGLFQNVFLIAAAVFFFSKHGIQVFIYAFLLSGLVQCINVTVCARKKYHHAFHGIVNASEMITLIRLSLPLILGNALYEINDVVDKRLSTELGAGSVSYLTYGGTINEMVCSIVIASVAAVLFPHYASWASRGETEEIEKHLTKSMEYLAALVLPFMVICLTCGDQIVALLYQRGNFGGIEVRNTYAVVCGYAVGFLFQAGRANLVKVYYAFQDTARPLINGVISVGINVALSVFFAKTLGIWGIALATSIAMLISMILLLCGIDRYLPQFSVRGSVKECGKLLIATVVVFGELFVFRKYVEGNLFILLSAEAILTFCTYAVLLWMLGSKSMLALVKQIKSMLEKR